MRTGDLIGMGTIAGSEKGTLGSLIEITRGGSRPLELVPDVSRRSLGDGGNVIRRAAVPSERRSVVVPAIYAFSMGTLTVEVSG